MDGRDVVHAGQVELDGNRYRVEVTRCGEQHFVATTRFAGQDVIAVDGISLEQVLDRHRRLLPLAVASRRLPRGPLDA